MMKRFFLFMLLLAAFSYAKGQHSPLFSQYMFNGLVINPAFSFGSDGLTAIVDYKKQWAGNIEGSPSTLTGTLHSSLKNEKFGIGLIYSLDHIGIKNQNDLSGSFTYRISTGKGLLGLGISGGFSMIKYSDNIITTDPGDPTFQDFQAPRFFPKIGFGAYYHSRNFFAGISIPQWVIQADNYGPGGVFARTFYFNTGFNYDINENLYITPSILIRAITGSPARTDLNVTATLNKIITGGVSYRMYNSVVLLLQFNHRNLTFGYAYDYSNDELSRLSYGSHEFMVKWKLGYGLNMPDPKSF